MPRTRPAYPPEFRAQIVALHRSGRSVQALAREFEPSPQTIRGRLKAARGVGVPDGAYGAAADTLTEAEREELRRLRREVRQLRVERDILSKGRRWSAIGPSDNGDAWFARGTPRPRGLRVHDREPGPLPDRHDGPCAGCLAQRLSRLAPSPALGPCRSGRRADDPDPRDPHGVARHPRLAARPWPRCARGHPRRAQAR